MEKILKRLSEISTKLKELEGGGEVAKIIRNRRKAERDGIIFALRSLGLEVTYDPYTGKWSVSASCLT